MAFSANPLANLAKVLTDVDYAVCNASPKCPRCGRPDGGCLRGDQTRWEAGMVDRKRCPETGCPMKREDAA